MDRDEALRVVKYAARILVDGFQDDPLTDDEIEQALSVLNSETEEV